MGLLAFQFLKVRQIYGKKFCALRWRTFAMSMRPYPLPDQKGVSKTMNTGTAPFNGISGAVRWGNRLFLACGLDGLKVFELKGNEAELFAHLTEFPAFDLVLRDGFIAVAAGKKGVVILDAVSLHPVKILTTDFPVHSIVWNKENIVAHAVSLRSNQRHKFVTL